MAARPREKKRERKKKKEREEKRPFSLISHISSKEAREGDHQRRGGGRGKEKREEGEKGFPYLFHSSCLLLANGLRRPTGRRQIRGRKRGKE